MPDDVKSILANSGGPPTAPAFTPQDATPPDIQPVNQQAPLSNPVQTQQQQPAPAKPGLWRSLLFGALAGMAQGAIDASPATLARQRAALANQKIAESQANIQQSQANIQLEQQRADLERQKFQMAQSEAQDERQLRQIQMAHMQTQIALAQRQLALLPQDRQDEIIDKLRDKTVDLVASGAQQVSSFKSYGDALAESARLMKSNNSFEFVVMPDPVNKNTWNVLRAPLNQKLTEEKVIDAPGGRKIVFPAGTPLTTFVDAQSRLVTDEINRASAERIASLNNSTRVTSQRIGIIRMMVPALLRARTTLQNASAAELSKQSFWQNIGLTPPPKGVDARKNGLAQIDSALQSLNDEASGYGVSLGMGPGVAPAAPNQAQEPPRPPNTPPDWKFDPNGPKGPAWYPPRILAHK